MRFFMYCHQYKIGDIFVLNSYKDKLYIKMLKFSKEIDNTITTSNFYLKYKETNVNDMAAQVFWAVFYSS